MSVVTERREGVIARLRRWWRDRTGITRAQASLEQTRELRREVRSALGSTTIAVRHARRRFGQQEWPELYRDRMRDLAA